MNIAPSLLLVALLSGCVTPSETTPTTSATAPTTAQAGASANATAPKAQTAPPLDAAAQARIEKRVEEQLRALEPEFWQKRSSAGEAKATEWLQAQALAIKKRETEAERKALAQ